jgi:ubiquinone/menaquinone biosynthesis C-methylase UbiE
MTLVKDPEGVETRNLLQAVDLSNRHVLEIGCGDGRLTWRYAPYAKHISAIDPDYPALREANLNPQSKLYKPISFICADSVNLPFPHETFDIALLAWSF